MAKFTAASSINPLKYIVSSLSLNHELVKYKFSELSLNFASRSPVIFSKFNPAAANFASSSGRSHCFRNSLSASETGSRNQRSHGNWAREEASSYSRVSAEESMKFERGQKGGRRIESEKNPEMLSVEGKPRHEGSKSASGFSPEKPDRLSKVLAAAGVASRRACEELIFEGRVTVNGKICKIPQTQVTPSKDSIYVDGRSLAKKYPPKLCFAVNKPKGYICSSVTSGSTKPAIDIVDGYMAVWQKRNPGVAKPRLFTIGRLDVNTTGLLIITNDGELAQKVSHPSSGLTKEYIATVASRVTRRQMASLAEGVEVDGVHCTPVDVDLLPVEAGDERHRIRIVVSEGRNREVRTLVASAGLELKSLKRVRIGGLNLNRKLGLGEYDVISPAQLRNIVFGNLK